MKCTHNSLPFILFAICGYVICDGSEESKCDSHSNESQHQPCAIQQKQLNKAESEVRKNEAFREYLIKKNITIKPEDPAYSFFNGQHFSKEDIHLFHKSDIILEVSKDYAEHLYKQNLPRSENINPLLSKNSFCFKKYFDKFCIDNKHIKCKSNQKYRRMDGLCTNLHFPKDGTAATAYGFLLPQNYEDSVSEIRKEFRTKNRLPRVREVAVKLLAGNNNLKVFLEYGPSLLGTHFSEIISQDVTFFVNQRNNPLVTCCKKDYSTVLPKELLHPNCYPIKIPRDDKFFGPLGITCMNFYRSQSVYDNNCVLSSKKQLNMATSFLDLSPIYGTNKDAMSKLRSFINGTLKMNEKHLFVEDKNGEFIVNDPRSLGSPMGAVLSVLFIREHNRIAKKMKQKFPDWCDETIFQEARRWNIAQYQVIVYDWLSIYIAEEYRDLRITQDEDEKVVVTTTNGFAHGVFRMHHKFIPETVQFYGENGKKLDEILFVDADPSELLRKHYDDLVRGLFYQKTNFNGCYNMIMNQLFKNSAGVGIDLFSFDIERGRDHGVQPYYKFVELCLKKKINSFSCLKGLISDEDIEKLPEVYYSVYDIDLYVGARLEIAPNEYQFGPIASCIINEQFYRYRRGDPFFYDNSEQNNPFTEEQLAEIQKASIARILCNNANIENVAKNPFYALMASGLNPKVKCKSVAKVNIVY